MRKRKAASGIMLTILLFSMLTLAFNIQLVRTEPRIIIVPDNYPTIQAGINAANLGDTIYVRAGTYYENVVVNKIVSLVGENKNTTIIDGKGTDLFMYGSAILLKANNATVSNFMIRNAGGGSAGIYIDRYYKNNVLSDNIIISNKWSGVYLDYGSSNNALSRNIISNNTALVDSFGLKLWSSNNNTFARNKIINNRYGFGMAGSSGNIFRDNELVGNVFNLDIVGYSLSSYIHDIDTSNTVDGKPICYWINKHSTQVPIDVGYVAAVSSTNITVRDLSLKKNGQGILFVNTNNSYITRVTTSNNVYALYLYSSSYNTIIGNNLSNNNNGMYLYASSKSNKVVGNTITSNNANGILLYSSSNAFYHNNFVNNKNYQVQNPWNSINSWDNGYPSGGNYWSNYTGVDANGDGIGDTPHIIDSNNQDNHPLIKPYIAGDINYDGFVEISDLTALGETYGAMPNSPNWNVRADINDDHIINAMDLAMLGRNYGKTDP
jgi:parallel beta-helix repeat protein